jgi:hypothetical protein
MTRWKARRKKSVLAEHENLLGKRKSTAPGAMNFSDGSPAPDVGERSGLRRVKSRRDDLYHFPIRR